MDLLKKLEMARHELLDMGLRANALLHIPRNKKYLDVVEERSSDVYRILVGEKKPMKFLPLPDIYEDDQDGEGDQPGENEEDAAPLPTLSEYLEEHAGEKRFGDGYLQTKLIARDLHSRLLRI